MELSRNSKWLKFYLTFNDYKPTNTCDYFWGSVKAILICLIILTVCGLLLTTLISPILLFWYEFNKESFISDFQMMGILAWFCIIVSVIVYKISSYITNRPYKYKEKKDSLFKIWYKDFKNKHCTMITWK